MTYASEQSQCLIQFCFDEMRVTASGELKSDGTVRGRKKALKTLVTNMEKSLELGEYGKDRLVCILHGDCMDDALAVKRMVNDLGFAFSK